MSRRPGPIRLVLLDDHRLIREGLRLLLSAEEDFDVMEEAGSLAELAELEADPDVVLCDLVLPDGRGAEVVRSVVERFPDAGVLVVTMVDHPSDVQMAFAAGARGYLLKEAASTVLVEGVRRVARGEDFLQPSLGAALAGLRQISTQAGAAAHVPLSSRETEVLRLLAIGHTNAEIADLLTLSLRTVESHRASLLSKLRLRTRAELAAYALQEGLIGD